MIVPAIETAHVTVYQGDALEVLVELAAASVDCIVTSPPYWGLRSYGTEPRVWGGDPTCSHSWDDEVVDVSRAQKGDAGSTLVDRGVGQVLASRFVARSSFCRCGAWRGEYGLEPTPALYVEHTTAIFRAARRVLRADGTLWLNLGDSYAARPDNFMRDRRGHNSKVRSALQTVQGAPHRKPLEGIKPKDLVGIPWRVAFALQEDGWFLRSDIVWSKPNPMPESVVDRPTKSHEYVFLLAKSARYFYDGAAIREPLADSSIARMGQATFWEQHGGPKDYGTNGTNPNRSTRGALENLAKRYRSGNRARFVAGEQLHPDIARGSVEAQARAARGRLNTHLGSAIPWEDDGTGRNARSVWDIATKPYPEAHFATFPEELPERCIKAGTRPGGVVLDPFAGSGTTLAVARDLGRRSIGIEIQPDYVRLIEKRVAQLALAMDGGG